MPLKNHADGAPQLLSLSATGAIKLLAENPHRALLNLAQGTDQGEQGGFAAARRSGEQHHLARRHCQVHALEHLAAHGTCAIPMAQVDQFDRCSSHGVQKISAGSASASRRIARAAEAIHITKIIVNTVTARVVSMNTGSWVALRTSRYKPWPAA